jgi:hypothetical protein
VREFLIDSIRTMMRAASSDPGRSFRLGPPCSGFFLVQRKEAVPVAESAAEDIQRETDDRVSDVHRLLRRFPANGPERHRPEARQTGTPE